MLNKCTAVNDVRMIIELSSCQFLVAALKVNKYERKFPTTEKIRRLLPGYVHT